MLKFEEWTMTLGAQQLKNEQPIAPTDDLEPTQQRYYDYCGGLDDPAMAHPPALWAQRQIADKLKAIRK